MNTSESNKSKVKIALEKKDKRETFLELLVEGEKGPFFELNGKFYDRMLAYIRNGKKS